ncbi:MAG TPA: glycine/sarcosine/betaine reductase component B subunit [Acidimicrobiales bacterium]|nr:glycine/sarcosine/betaine reductase component B subunit [Acidimicrobiales bacterium]
MALARFVHDVRAVEFASTTALADGLLSVAADEAAALLADPALADVRLSWASPGQAVRIVKVLDAVQPCAKPAGDGWVFPGLLGPARPQGRGRTHVLRGVAVVSAGYLPRAQEAVVDLSGPGAELSPLGTLHNLVVEFTPAPDAAWDRVYAALRHGTLVLARYLAEAALDVEPDEVDELPGPGDRSGTSGLPVVGAITNLQTQGAFKDTFVYGRSLNASLPFLIDPNELDDGAVVSGQLGHPGLKNPTWMFQNHPVAAALRRRHGRDLHFGGVVLCPEPVDQEAKAMISALAARLCATAGFDAVVLTKEGGGNADADVAMKMDELEALGLAAVGLFAEMAGTDGTAPPLVVPPERATLMVSTGNYDERLVLPAVERAFGGDRVDLVRSPATAELQLPTAAVYCSLSPLGWGRLTCAEEVAA